MRITNKLNLPEAFVLAAQNDGYSAEGCDTTVTRLVQPPRKVFLEKRHWKDLEQDISDLFWSLLGQGVHSVLERAGQNALCEKRLIVTRHGWRIGGRLDSFHPENCVLIDYKTTSVYGVANGAKSEWIAQLNLLALMLQEEGYDVRRMEAVAILRDWHRSYVGRTDDYPIAPVLRLEVPMWTLEAAEEYLDTRLRLHQLAATALPECSPEERWERPSVWALMKPGRKSAVKLFESEDDARTAAEAVSKDHYIQLRPGKCLRCESYCPAAPFCSQWKRIREAQGTENGTKDG